MNNTRQNLLSSKQLHISCIVPAYNEQDNIVNFIQKLTEQLQALSNNFEIILVDDGSKDNTLEKVYPIINQNIKLIALSRNFGKENALTAGLDHASGDVTILIDADFQHPIDLIPTFLKYWADGYEMVYGIRKNRQHEPLFKRLFTKCFYILAKTTKPNIPPNAGDFRLLDKKIVQAINSMTERNRFMKGLYAWVGFKTIGIQFDVAERAAGKSTLSFYRLTDLALTGITSFSNVPLRVWSLIGIIISFIAFLYGAYIVFKTLILGIDIPGYATIIVAIMFFGGIQLLSIGILGEYLARIFNEVKHRPNYLISQKIGFN